MVVETYFAPSEKAKDTDLAIEIDTVANNPILNGLLHSVSGLLAVLNEYRQVLALNDSFMRTIGIENSDTAFGLRHGKLLKCIHAEEEPGGCGTTEFCSTCGAAIAIVSTLEHDQPIEKLCALTIEVDGATINKAFLVKSHPVLIDEKRFILLFLQDITQEEKRAALERTFFHDINNLIYILGGTSELLLQEHPSELAQTLYETSQRIQREVHIQRCLVEEREYTYSVSWSECSTNKILSQLESIFTSHPLSRGRSIDFVNNCNGVYVTTDLTLLLRVLSNMVINALEASEPDDTIRVMCSGAADHTNFSVWNPQEIPSDVARRIFSRNYSTKGGAGRGIGTYSMKLFGEKYLGGKIFFRTSKTEGTTFTYKHLR